MTTIPFGRGPQKDPLLAQASGLPQEIAPARDLWPGIETRLAAPSRAMPRRIRWPLALAAGFLVASISALLTWGLLRDPGPNAGETMLAQNPATQPALLPVRYGPNSALGAVQLKARDDLLRQFRKQFAALPPETREIVAKNLAIIQHAADEIDAALGLDPASGLLNGLLFSTYQKELELYSRVVAAGDDRARRT